VSKLADNVIQDTNPIEDYPDSIKDIQVLETIKAGRSIFVVK
jgi:predicted amidohydrolase YtcJ